MVRLVLVEGLPGSGKTTTARMIADGLTARGLDARYFGEGRSDHPADLDEVALLAEADMESLADDLPAHATTLTDIAERHDGYWLVRHRERADWPDEVRRWLRDRDAYDGHIGLDLHLRASSENWRRFAGAAATDPAVFVFEAVALQNPVCALLARFDQPPSALRAHVRRLVSTVADLDPLLIYLDGGDPEPVLAAAAAERPPAWLDVVIRYHTEQGYGAARGLRGFPGLVDFMRMRRELEVHLVGELGIRAHVVDVAARDPDAHRRAIDAILEQHLGPDGSASR